MPGDHHSSQRLISGGGHLMLQKTLLKMLANTACAKV